MNDNVYKLYDFILFIFLFSLIYKYLGSPSRSTPHTSKELFEQMSAIITRYNSHLSAVLSKNELDITRERERNSFHNQRIIEEED